MLTPRRTKRKHSCRVGGLDDVELRDHRPDGPNTLNDLFAIGDQAWRSLTERASPERVREMKDCLSANLARGIDVHSYYGGKATEASAIQQLLQTLKKVGFLAEDDDPVRFVRYSEIDADLVRTVAEMKKDDGSSLYEHIHGAIEKRFHAAALRDIGKMIPPKDADVGLKVEAYCEIDSYLRRRSQHPDEVYKMDLHGYRIDECYQCNSLFCKLHPIVSMDSDSSNSRDSDESNSDESNAPTLQMGGVREKRICLVIAGSSCEDFSRRGKQLGIGGPHMKEWCLFKHELRMLAHPSHHRVLLHEISDVCPEQFVEDNFKDVGLDCITGVQSSTDLGWAVKRPRRYSAGWDHCIRFLGSYSEYEDVFFCTPVLSCDDFLLASAEERRECDRAMAQNLGHHLEPGMDATLMQTLTAKEYHLFSEVKSSQGMLSSISGAICCDVQQNTSHSSPGPWLPSFGKKHEISFRVSREDLHQRGDPCDSGRAHVSANCDSIFKPAPAQGRAPGSAAQHMEASQGGWQCHAHGKHSHMVLICDGEFKN